MVLVCHVIFQDHLKKWSINFMGWSLYSFMGRMVSSLHNAHRILMRIRKLFVFNETAVIKIYSFSFYLLLIFIYYLLFMFSLG